MSRPLGDIAEFYERLWRTPDADAENAARWSFQTPLVDRALAALGDVHGKTVLEIGPGAGREATWLVAAGAQTVTIDLVAASLLRTRQATSNRAHLLRARAEQLPIAAGSVDAIFIQTTLMHLDRAAAAAEWARVLRPQGRVVILEPIAGNPLVGLYRRLLSPYKVTAPRYIKVADLVALHPELELTHHEEHHLLAIVGLALPAAIAAPIQGLLQRLDDVLLRIAFLRRFAWMTLAELRPYRRH